MHKTAPRPLSLHSSQPVDFMAFSPLHELVRQRLAHAPKRREQTGRVPRAEADRRADREPDAAAATAFTDHTVGRHATRRQPVLLVESVSQRSVLYERPSPFRPYDRRTVSWPQARTLRRHWSLVLEPTRVAVTAHVAGQKRWTRLRTWAHLHMPVLAVVAGARPAKEERTHWHLVLLRECRDIHWFSRQASEHTPVRDRTTEPHTWSCVCERRHLAVAHSLRKNLRQMATRRLSWMNEHAFCFLQ